MKKVQDIYDLGLFSLLEVLCHLTNVLLKVKLIQGGCGVVKLHNSS
jgi:hypothetical protein